MAIIHSVFDRQFEVLDAIDRLHGIKRYDVDPTYGCGSLHTARNRPDFCSDIDPLWGDGVLKHDCRDLPQESGSVGSIIFDPPFLAAGGISGIMHARYSSFRTVKSLYEFYNDAMAEFVRILRHKGLLVFKCQDILNGRTQGFSHCEIYLMALKLGYYAKDLFILTQNNRLPPTNMKTQQHARKAHCYFWVFQKGGRNNHQLDTVQRAK